MDAFYALSPCVSEIVSTLRDRKYDSETLRMLYTVMRCVAISGANELLVAIRGLGSGLVVALDACVAAQSAWTRESNAENFKAFNIARQNLEQLIDLDRHLVQRFVNRCDILCMHAQGVV